MEVHKYDLKASALLAGLPLLVGGFGSAATGWLTPHLQHHLGGVGRTRRVIGVVGLVCAPACLFAATTLHQPLLAVTAIACASFFNDLTLPGAWKTCMDMGDKYVGTISGAMNMMGNLGGLVSPSVLGHIAVRKGNGNVTLYLTAGL